MTRPAVLLLVLVPLHLGAQHLLLGRVVLPLLTLPLLAVAAFEALDRAGWRASGRRKP